MGVEIRSLTADELPELFKLTSYVFGGNPTGDQPNPIMPEWTTCALVDGRLATSFGAWPFRVRLNGRSVGMAGVTMVGTWPEFRRRGLLRQVMTQSFADQRDEKQSIAILWASMAAIYQRFGYGAATTGTRYRVDRRFIQFRDGEQAGGRVRLVSKEDARPTLAAIYKEYNRPRNLMVQRAAPLWEARLGGDGSERNQYGVYHDSAGTPRGYVVYRISYDAAVQVGPTQVIDVIDWAALDADAYRGMWEHFAAHDLVCRVEIGVPEDDPAPLLMLEPRELKRQTGDGIWMRITDVAGALPQRPYGDAGVLTIRVRDDLCPWNDGVWSIETTGDETEVRRVQNAHDADITAPVNVLSVLLSGHRPATTLAHAGLLEVGNEKALPVADRLFATTFAPYCADGF